MNNTAKGTLYELFVRDIIASIHEAQEVTTICVEHNKTIRGLSSDHQVDVYWEHRIGGVTFRVAIECKNWTKEVDENVVRSALGMRQDIPGLQVIIVSPLGFQPGAVALARAHSIGLKIIRQPEPESGDYAGINWVRPQKISMKFILRSNEATNMNIRVDPEWVAKGIPQDVHDLIGVTGRCAIDHTVFDIIESGLATRQTIVDLVNKIPPSDEAEKVTRFEFRWADAWALIGPNKLRTKIIGVDFEYKTHVFTEEITIKSEEAKAIVRDIINETLLIIENDKRVIGDVEQEGIPNTKNIPTIGTSYMAHKG